jgi:LPS O-antigen subunit length determinant protein (WzzB/FepE family)
MTQYDAGPGDWSDREWEEPDRKRKPHTTRRRLVLPPWALLAILVGVVIVLCVALMRRIFLRSVS